MKLTIDENSRNYVCSVVEIKKIMPIKGADNIVKTIVNGNVVVCSKDVKEGSKMLYFVSGTKLNPDYCKANNLYDKAEENKDTTKKGFISFKQKRVKAIRLKGEISDGMLMPLSSLNYFLESSSINSLNIGDEFTEINGNTLCEKYIIPVNISIQNTKKIKDTNKLKDLIVDNQFRFHHETEHFVKNLNKFDSNSEIIITRKLHGSSLILSNVLVNKKLSFKEKLFKFFGVKIPTTEYGIIWSSGKPKSRLPKGVNSESNKWKHTNPSYYTSDIWSRAYEEIGHAIRKGITIYGEIIGKGIQGDDFTYNQEYGIYIYRITQTSIEGDVIEFSWEQLKDYCNRFGLNHVEEYFVGKVNELANSNEDFLSYLQNRYLNKSYYDCKTDEGICIRIRKTDEIFKLKSPNFIKMESDKAEIEESNLEDNQ